MGLTVIVVFCGGLLCGLIVLLVKYMGKRDADRMRRHRISAEELHELRSSARDVLIFDVRQPLDLLANLEIIPGAKRIPPKEVLEMPSLIPKERDSVVYCTCPSDKTSRAVLRQALALHFSRIKFLEGGLAAWKAKGYPVEEYQESFHLDTRT
jgi:rhodanese-related sulfurtransferase